MGKTLYLECYSGISGDMTVGALLDLGTDESVLMKTLKSLPLDEFDIAVTRVKKSGLDACDFHVILDEAHNPHDHDMEYLHGHERHSENGHSHAHAEPHNHEHNHAYIKRHDHEHNDTGAEGHHHSHVHRGLPEIREIIQNSDMTKRAKDTALRIFGILADAEAKAHGVPAEQVHFHEVGALDSIVDIAAVSVCLDNLDITEVITGELYEGRGTIRCQHGVIPVPAPAVVHIAASHQLTLHMTETEGELVTPTGAAIVAAIKTADKLPNKYRILDIGMGAGKRDYGRAGVLRAMLVEPEEMEVQAADIQKTDMIGKDTIWHLESNIDDCTGEALGYVMNRLMEEGARDVYYTPAYMKKNRPAYELNVICMEEEMERLQEIIFQNTTTIGIRRMKMERTVLNRELRESDTSLGKVQVKVCKIGTEQRSYPEYESIVRLCREHGLSYQEVWRIVCREVCG
ncbi:MAG: nickel pincer cofactor biosynthesis protein LarC [Dorea sp.]|nr:nickel pincer cofactor biosynthesis protein LarC [Dorea sp.]